MPRKGRTQPTYYTGLVALHDDVQRIRRPINGAGWRISFVKPERARTFSRGREVAIRAASWISAQRALNLIIASLILISGDPPLFDSESELVAHNDIEPEFSDPHFRQVAVERSFSTPGIPLACSVAAKASRNQKWLYAITKYKFSISLYGVFHVDLEPHRARHLPVSRFPDDHVMFAHAVVSAYSVLEDLGLELRASQKNPSRIKGNWNPPVKQNLERRLVASGVDLNEPILWTVRGPRRGTEKRRAMPILDKTPWAVGPAVRDCRVQLVDAIAYADWLRDCVASHNVKDLTKVLSPYDVVNVQHLARRLTMEVLKVWRFHKRKE